MLHYLRTRKALGGLLALSALVIACGNQPGSHPETKPLPGDNVLRIELHAFYVRDADGTVHDPSEAHIPLHLRIDAYNGEGVPLTADDGLPLSNWTTYSITPFVIELSSGPTSKGGNHIGGSLRYDLKDIPKVDGNPRQVRYSVTCTFFKNGVEVPQLAQAGTPCLWAVGF
jgi:hypothetical protein